MCCELDLVDFGSVRVVTFCTVGREGKCMYVCWSVLPTCMPSENVLLIDWVQ